MSRSSSAGVVFFLSLFAALTLSAAKHVEYIQPVERTIPAAGVRQVVLQNMVGPISIQTTDTDTIHLTALVHAGGLDDVFARTLANEVTFDVKNDNGQLRIIVNYPVKQFHNYGYPHMKLVGVKGIGIHGTDTNEYGGEKIHIRAAGNKKSIELWAEIRLELPNSEGLVIRNIYGDVETRGEGAAGDGLFDCFTDVGDMTIVNPRWKQVKVESDYGKVSFTEGFGATLDIDVKTDWGGSYFYLDPGATGKIVARKDLGFLHNQFTNSHFEKDENGNSVMVLGDGHGTTVHVDMSVGSLHLERAAG
jgi:hypothetical protein